jgi:hypothetical protein
MIKCVNIFIKILLVADIIGVIKKISKNKSINVELSVIYSIILFVNMAYFVISFHAFRLKHQDPRSLIQLQKIIWRPLVKIVKIWMAKIVLAFICHFVIFRVTKVWTENDNGVNLSLGSNLPEDTAVIQRSIIRFITTKFLLSVVISICEGLNLYRATNGENH